MRNIVLFGFMGTGKTVAGKKVARRLDMQFVDMDDVIEEKEACTISQIFAEKGENYFREVESEVAHSLSRREGLVIATGGGVVLRRDNVDALQLSGTGICLTASPEVIYERVKGQRHRPLLMTDDPAQSMRSLLAYRAPFYARAKYRIDTSDLTVESVVERIVDIAKQDQKLPAGSGCRDKDTPDPRYSQA